MKLFVQDFAKSCRMTWPLLPLLSVACILCLILSTQSFAGLEKKTMRKTCKVPISKPLKSSAQSATLCVLPGQAKIVSELIVDRINSDSDLSIIIKALVELQFSHGLRISECLAIDNSDLLSSNRIRIKSLKGSIQRIIVFNDSHGYFKMCRSTGSKPFDCISRFCVYRIYKRIGISYYDGTSAYSSVTHAPRHIVASELRKVDKDNTFTSDFSTS